MEGKQTNKQKNMSLSLRDEHGNEYVMAPISGDDAIAKGETATAAGGGVPQGWLDRPDRRPTIRGEDTASLATCYLNVGDKSCNFHMQQKYQDFLRSWRNSAPPHCQPADGGVRDPLPTLYRNRLGVNMEPICEQFR